jgi:branched-chain amino acid transport system ATP-binding protein
MVGCFMRTSSRVQALEQADEVMQLLKLHSSAEVQVSELPVASQKRVTMATALATRPKLLLLDEVAAGLNSGEIDEILGYIRHIHGQLGVTVMLIEHVMELVMKISQRVFVLDSGKLISHGSPDTVAKDPKVIQAYLGERYAKEYLDT